MFTRPDQLQRKGGPEERLSFLQKLKDEYTTTKSLEGKQQVLANLANFAYDPINYNFIKQLQIVDLFLNQLQLQQNEELCAFAVGGLCNLCNDPEIADYITSDWVIAALIKLLQHRNKDIVLNALTTLYYLARNVNSAYLIKTPTNLHKLRAFHAAHRTNSCDPRLTNLATIFLRDIWDANDANSNHSESAEVSSD
ncbi:armadillo repeat-containing protein 7 [Atheta coriaria]|uniref:armadillo repeat-containing protein 7 n=1 Tax=Dalotia coriaria TaxID=877792 RepID=UPI0031F350BE